jgi:hypothetical protein
MPVKPPNRKTLFMFKKIVDFSGRFKIAILLHRCRILTLGSDRLKQLGTFCKKTATAFFDAIMEAALKCVGLSKNKIEIA